MSEQEWAPHGYGTEDHPCVSCPETPSRHCCYFWNEDPQPLIDGWTPDGDFTLPDANPWPHVRLIGPWKRRTGVRTRWLGRWGRDGTQGEWGDA